MSGNNGFAETDDTFKVAKLVIKKIKQGEMSPAIFVKELRRLKASG
ncbi:MAG: DUF4907 domain-containing protein [Saprospiraceae bacterium]|uniref:DUF4907 domain-containing protein n=1 Tax=Candidatus Opimibacter skivensis TaxID=2982028 RepID=A0A9D7STZ0_9BACT|nr:DUF4907 domain-containing protein [Candidatus Opimibacter skivensis]